jgi:hypothetical protein
MEIAPRNQPPMQESFGPPKSGTHFVDDGEITEINTCSKKLISNY